MQAPLLDIHFEVANSNGIPRALLHQRYYQSNWSLERATTEPVNKKKPSEHKPYVDAAQVSGIHRSTYLTRVAAGMTKEEASTKPASKRGRPKGTHCTDRPYTPEQLALAESNGISRQALNGRLKRKWDLERAITEPPNEFWVRNHGEKTQIHATSQSTMRKRAKQIKDLEDYANEMHNIAYGRDKLTPFKRDRLKSKVHKEHGGFMFVNGFDSILTSK